MGLKFNDAKGLIEWRAGKAGGSVAMIGRLSLTFHPSDIAALKRMVSGNEKALAYFESYKWGDYAEPFFRVVLAYDEVESIDFSDYEGASIIQNIGEPLGEGLAGRFDLAIDGGTLEHVFNFPVAVGNLMRLVKVGGAAYMHTPSNNLSGHGFYQIGPELVYRVFSDKNGFEPIFVRLSIGRNPSVEQTTNQPVYDVEDPAKVGSRVMLQCSRPAMIMALATKVREVEPFSEPVLQSDYVAKWGETGPASLNWKGRLLERLRGGGFPAW